MVFTPTWVSKELLHRLETARYTANSRRVTVVAINQTLERMLDSAHQRQDMNIYVSNAVIF